MEGEEAWKKKSSGELGTTPRKEKTSASFLAPPRSEMRVGRSDEALLSSAPSLGTNVSPQSKRLSKSILKGPTTRAVPSVSDPPESSETAPLNVSHELHRLNNTPRAAKFLEFVRGKRSPEPFLCWVALERLIGEVRDNTLESPESRSKKVCEIVEEFVAESAPNQLGLPMAIKDKMNDLYQRVRASSEYWDGRPLLLLQREAELMLLPDVREFAQTHPWEASDEASPDGAAATFLAFVLSAPASAAKVAEVLRSGYARRQAEQKSKTGIRAAIRNRTSTLKSKLSGSADVAAAQEVPLLGGELRPCRVLRSSVVVGAPVADDGAAEVDPTEFSMSLRGAIVSLHEKECALQISGPARVMLLFCDDAHVLDKWKSVLADSVAKCDALDAQLREKRQRILAMPVVSGGGSAVSPRMFSVMPSLSESTGVMNRAKAKKTRLGRSGQGALPGQTMTDLLSVAAYGGPAEAAAAGGSGMTYVQAHPGPPVQQGSMSNLLSAAGYGSPAVDGGTGYGGFPPGVSAASGGGGDAAAAVVGDGDSSSGGSDDEDGVVGGGGGRDDFNEVFQRCMTRLQSLVNVQHGDVDRLRMETFIDLIGLAEDFVSSAVRYGQIIISEVYLPAHRKTIRPDTSVGGVIGGEKYVVHNILFKFAIDSSNVFGGNDESAAKVAGLELKGLQAYMSSNTPDLCYPLMALLDYKGFRLVASSLLPLTRSSLQYGSQNAAVTIKKGNPDLTARIEQASRALNLKLHEAGKDRVVVATAVDIEGHVGKDGRFYLLDFSRVFPCVTPNRNVQSSHLFQMFRSEFVRSFTLFPLCSDAYSNFTAGLPDAKEHAEEVDLATMELLNVSVSNLVVELIARMSEEARIVGTLENFALTQLLHSHGVNVRYLGEVLRKLGRHPFGTVVLTTMVARVVKIGFRKTLRAAMKSLRVSIDEPYRIAAKDFLNTVFGNTPASDDYWAVEVPNMLNQRFGLRPGNWTAFPKNLKRTLFEVERVNSAAFNAKAVIFLQMQNALGLKVAPSLVTLLQTQPKVYAQKAVFDDVDVEDVGLRVKFLDIISNAQGFVFSKRASEKEKEGFFEAAKALYQRAYVGYQSALSSCPNDSTLLRNCALVTTKLYRLSQSSTQRKLSVAETTLQGASLDDPLLFSAQQNYRKAIQANRKSPVFFTSYADFLRDLGLYEDAEAHYIEALLRDAHAVSTLRKYAALLRVVGNTADAAAFELRATAVFGSNPCLSSSE